MKPKKVLLIGSGPIVCNGAKNESESKALEAYSAHVFKPTFSDFLEVKSLFFYRGFQVDSMEIHLENLPDFFLIKLDDEFRNRLFADLNWKKTSKEIGISNSYYYHLKNNRCAFRLKLLKRLLLLKQISLTEAEKHVAVILSTRGGKIFAKLPIITSISLARLVGHCFGDGSISRKKGEFDYVNLDLELIEQIRSDVKFVFDSKPTYEGLSKDGTYKINFSSLVGCILELAGAPRGEKVKSILTVPDWIKRDSMEIKSAFLQALFDDDGSVLYSEKYAAKNVNLHFTRVFENDAYFVAYLNDLRNLLGDLGIISSNPYIARKYFVNGSERVVRGFVINRKAEVQNFYSNVNFAQADKRSRLQLIIRKGGKHTETQKSVVGR